MTETRTAKPLEEKVALVTGGAQRIGRAIVRGLARAGCDVVIHYRDSATDAAGLAEELRSMGRQAWLVQGDLGEEDEPEAVLRTAWDMAGWVDILVNNASTYSRRALCDADAVEFDRHWRVNALAPMLLTKVFAECVGATDILPADYLGHVINVLDRRVAGTDAGALPYWVSKCALHAFTRGAARELAPRLAVNAVAPGAVLPPVTGAVEGVDPAGDQPLATRCTPENVCEAIVFLASSRTLTGQVVYVDGGQHLL